MNIMLVSVTEPKRGKIGRTQSDWSEAQQHPDCNS